MCALPVVPLFETVEDLEGSPDILRAFLEHPVARLSLQKQAGDDTPTQQVMVGYSDSNKTKAFRVAVGLAKSPERNGAGGESTGVKIRFFSRQGGTISRGAGPLTVFWKHFPTAV
jgi:phosphoenolpyruvate carboxylase